MAGALGWAWGGPSPSLPLPSPSLPPSLAPFVVVEYESQCGSVPSILILTSYYGPFTSYENTRTCMQENDQWITPGCSEALNNASQIYH